MFKLNLFYRLSLKEKGFRSTIVDLKRTLFNIT